MKPFLIFMKSYAALLKLFMTCLADYILKAALHYQQKDTHIATKSQEINKNFS